MCVGIFITPAYIVLAWSELTFALIGDLSFSENVDGPGQCLVADVTVGGSVVHDLHKLVTTNVDCCLLRSNNMSQVSTHRCGST